MSDQAMFGLVCQHAGCTDPNVSEWVITGYEKPLPTFYYCPQHAAEAGFCVYCGAFVGGTEDFLKSGVQGLCFDCFYQLEEEPRAFWEEYDDEYEEDYE